MSSENISQNESILSKEELKECTLYKSNWILQTKCRNPSCLLQFGDELKKQREAVEEYKKANLADHEKILSCFQKTYLYLSLIETFFFVNRPL